MVRYSIPSSSALRPQYFSKGVPYKGPRGLGSGLCLEKKVMWSRVKWFTIIHKVMMDHATCYTGLRWRPNRKAHTECSDKPERILKMPGIYYIMSHPQNSVFWNDSQHVTLLFQGSREWASPCRPLLPGLSQANVTREWKELVSCFLPCLGLILNLDWDPSLFFLGLSHGVGTESKRVTDRRCTDIPDLTYKSHLVIPCCYFYCTLRRHSQRPIQSYGYRVCFTMGHM